MHGAGQLTNKEEQAGQQLTCSDESTILDCADTFDDDAFFIVAVRELTGTVLAHFPGSMPTGDGGRSAFAGGLIIRVAGTVALMLAVATVTGEGFFTCGHLRQKSKKKLSI